jgi:hypothetical protein
MRATNDLRIGPPYRGNLIHNCPKDDRLELRIDTFSYVPRTVIPTNTNGSSTVPPTDTRKGEDDLAD